MTRVVLTAFAKIWHRSAFFSLTLNRSYQKLCGMFLCRVELEQLILEQIIADLLKGSRSGHLVFFQSSDET